MTKENMKIWAQVSESNPEYLKRVSFGQRNFTAIDPQYQIMTATEIFGPVGEGWGYHTDINFITTANNDIIAVADVTIWHGNPSNSFGPVPGCRRFYDAAKGRTNEDATKMAVTDALTKGLSHLGFNADVFLGKMDGNKYTNEPTTTKGDW